VVVEGDLHDVTDMEWLAADQVTAQLLDLSNDRSVAVILAVGLTPPDNAGIGGNPHKHKILAPTGMNGKTFNAHNFHGDRQSIENPSCRCPATCHVMLSADSMPLAFLSGGQLQRARVVVFASPVHVPLLRARVCTRAGFGGAWSGPSARANGRR